MEKIAFENFIGKNIKELELLHIGKVSHMTEFNKYYMDSEEGNLFYDKILRYTEVTTDKNNIIEDITIYFHGIVGDEFYDSFKDNYGLPNEILIEKETKMINDEKFEGNLSGRATSWFTTLKKGTFKENPLLIKWDKGKYQIVFFLKHEINVTEIRFSIPRDDFK